ncbi:nephrocystin-1-like isoform X2 [Rhopilema esculentum]|uniref:nephrocystin-1-like isoform X2 n=1 Tax=Rhopilema esculentum TaxID=499914 RepID=UPI0031D876A2
MASTTKKLPKIKREIDKLKFKVDELCDHEIPHLGAASPDRKSVYDKCSNLTAAVYDLISQIGQLSLKNEKLPTKEFEAAKAAEGRRLTVLREKLEQISSQLEPDEVEEDYLSKFVGGDAPSVSDANSFDGHHEADGDDYETDESIEVYRVEAFGDFAGEEVGDLQFKKGEILTIITTRDDGWWTAENKDGKTGLVPSTLLKILDDEEDDKEVENKDKPGKIVSEKPPLQKKRSGKDLWQSLRMSKAETTVNDVLKAMKAVPSGFRSSTLGIMLKQEEHKTSFWLTPKLSSSNLSFRDLFWDPVNKKLRPRAVKLTRTFSLMGAKFIPLPGAGLEVKSRHVRISFWDGKNVYGNIHTVRAIAVEKDEQSWSFTPRLSVFLPSLYDGECIARINSATENLALLFELNYSYVRTTTEDKGELSAGWCTLPLFEKDGTPIVNKNYELALHGGTPFEKGVDVDAALSLKTSQSLFQSLIRTNRQPRLIVKLTPINRVEKAQFDLLPDLLITCERHIKFIVLYRELLANTYLKDGEPSGEYICDPIMANICKAFDFSDLIDALQMIWNERSKVNLSRSQKRDQAHMLKFFRQCFIESTFSIMNNVKFPPYIWANETAEQERVKFITSYLAEKNSLALMFAPSSTFKPFNTRKVSFDVLSNKSLLNSESS